MTDQHERAVRTAASDRVGAPSRREGLKVGLAGLAGLGLALPSLPRQARAAETGNGGGGSDGGVDLPTAQPEALGVDSAPLVALSRRIRQDDLDVRSLLVVKDGRVIFERYSRGLTRAHNYELYSITKNVSALCAGMLVDDGRSRLDEKIAPILARVRPDLQQALADKQAIELRHVLAMSTGLHYAFQPTDDPIYDSAPDRLVLATRTEPRGVPGQAFDYTDVNPILASAVLGADAGMPLQQFAQQRLFAPMGMRNHAWERADQTGLVSCGWGLRLRAMDLAKLGQLVLQGGRWQGRQLVSQAWIRTMTAPSSAPWYGLYWWLNDIVGTEPEVHAMGFKGQFVVALPMRNAVVVVTAMLPIDGGLRESRNVQVVRAMVNDHVLPALENRAGATPAPARLQALRAELRLAARHKGRPGVAADPTDTPRA